MNFDCPILALISNLKVWTLSGFFFDDVNSQQRQ